MSLQYRFSRTLVLSLLIITVVGCASDRDTFYKHQPSIQPLEVPPDLTLLDANTGFEIPAVGSVERKQQMLDDADAKIKLHKDGQLRWLEIDASPDLVWEEIKDFWISSRVPLSWQNLKLGIMETEWVKSYDSDFVLDRFRTRVEPLNKGAKSEIYLTHRGAQETMIEGEVLEGWTATTNDKELEIEVLGEMLSFLGLAAERKSALLDDAKQNAEFAYLKVDSDIPHILMLEPFSRGWKFTIQGLDRMGHIITNRNRKEGWVELRITDDGNTSDFVPVFQLTSEEREIYRVQIERNGEEVKISILTDEGLPDRSALAIKFLEELHSYL